MKQKASLTLEEKAKAAYLHICLGLDQHTIALIAFDAPVNQGRVNEACTTVERALRAMPGSDNGSS